MSAEKNWFKYAGSASRKTGRTWICSRETLRDNWRSLSHTHCLHVTCVERNSPEPFAFLRGYLSSRHAMYTLTTEERRFPVYHAAINIPLPWTPQDADKRLVPTCPNGRTDPRKTRSPISAGESFAGEVLLCTIHRCRPPFRLNCPATPTLHLQ